MLKKSMIVDMKDDWIDLLTSIVVLIVEFFFTIGATWVIFYCFNMYWTFEYGVGIFFIICLVNLAVSPGRMRE